MNGDPKICPVCKGAGMVPGNPAVASGAAPVLVCHGCGGKGWVGPGMLESEILEVLKKIEYKIGVLASIAKNPPTGGGVEG
jgi:hypothetical protein